MNQNPNPNQTDAVVSSLASGNMSQTEFQSFVQLLLAKEKRLIEKEAELERMQTERDKQARVSSEQFTISKIETQVKCSHLKGGKSRQRGQQKDPAVYVHTFTDGTTVIKCQICGARWMEKDTVEYLHRNGSAIPNWTHKGWKEALELAGESSNKPSSSERFFAPPPTSAIPVDKKGVSVPNLQI